MAMDLTDEEIAAVAMAVDAQALAITAQFFAVHRLAEHDPVACVRHENAGWSIYLRLEEEPYFWVSHVQLRSERLEATGGFPSAFADVYLAIGSDSMDPEQISAHLDLKPSEVNRKGELIEWGGIKTTKTFEQHRWYYRPSCPEPLDFETKLSSLLDDLSPRADRYRALEDRCEGVVRVAYLEYAGDPSGWALDRRVVRELAALGLWLDVDLYVSGPDLPETDLTPFISHSR